MATLPNIIATQAESRISVHSLHTTQHALPFSHLPADEDNEIRGVHAIAKELGIEPVYIKFGSQAENIVYSLKARKGVWRQCLNCGSDRPSHME